MNAAVGITPEHVVKDAILAFRTASLTSDAAKLALALVEKHVERLLEIWSPDYETEQRRQVTEALAGLAQSGGHLVLNDVSMQRLGAALQQAARAVAEGRK